MELPKRRSPRLKGYDYSRNGAYFVTICTYKRKKMLSSIVGEGSPLPQLTVAGMIAKKWIECIDQKYPTVLPKYYVIMPNHIHLLLHMIGDGRGDPSPTVNDVVGWLKYHITREVNSFLHSNGEKQFQRSYHDHVIRDKHDYDKIATYIHENPLKWKDDRFYYEGECDATKTIH